MSCKKISLQVNLERFWGLELPNTVSSETDWGPSIRGVGEQISSLGERQMSLTLKEAASSKNWWFLNNSSYGIDNYNRWVVFKLYSSVQHLSIFHRESVALVPTSATALAVYLQGLDEQNSWGDSCSSEIKVILLPLLYTFNYINTYWLFSDPSSMSHLIGPLFCGNFSFAHMDDHRNHFRILHKVAIKMTLAHMFDCRADIYPRSNSFYSINKGFDLFILASLSKHSSSAEKWSRFQVSGPYIYKTHAHICTHIQIHVCTQAGILPPLTSFGVSALLLRGII